MNIITVDSLTAQLEALGVAPGHTVIVHASLSKVQDWICGGTNAVVQAFERALGPGGTLVMPAHSSDNTEPSEWHNPPVPEDWWPVIRAHMPAYDPETTVTRKMGALAEMFRRYPGTRRSGHPQLSIAARGEKSAYLTAEHLLTDAFGETSPYAKLVELDAHVLLLGVDHSNNSTLHLAETRAQWPSKSRKTQGAAIRVNGQRRWVTFDDWADDASDFHRIGADYEASMGYRPGRIGQAETRYLRLRPLVDFAVEWMSTNRT